MRHCHLISLTLALVACTVHANTCVEVPADYVAKINPTATMSHLSTTSKDKTQQFTSADSSLGWSVASIILDGTIKPKFIEVSNRGRDFPASIQWGLFRFVKKDFKVSKWYWLENFHACDFDDLDYSELLDVNVAYSSLAPPPRPALQPCKEVTDGSLKRYNPSASMKQLISLGNGPTKKFISEDRVKEGWIVANARLSQDTVEDHWTGVQIVKGSPEAGPLNMFRFNRVDRKTKGAWHWLNEGQACIIYGVAPSEIGTVDYHTIGPL